jgi:hypothetical protein
MDKKTLRKDLERAVSKSIIETLSKQNAAAGKLIKKKVNEVSKTIAKKFYKALKDLSSNKAVPVKTVTALPVKRNVVLAKKTALGASRKIKK